MPRRLVLTALLLFSAFAIGADTAKHISIAGRDVAVWKPATTAPVGGYPLVLFSHGYSGCNTQSVFLMEALSKAGYIVLAPNHQDARCGSSWGEPGARSKGKKHLKPEEPFRDQSKWSNATYRDRQQDIEAVLDAVLASGIVDGTAIDAARIGLSGHSLGGYTALGVAGAWPSWKDRRIKAVLALAAYTSPFVDKGDLTHLAVPVMYQGGTRDLGVTPTVRRFQGAYDKSSAPKYYVEFDGAGHFAWTNINPKYQRVISDYSVAFFDRYLKATSSRRLDELARTPPPEVSYIKADAK